MKSIKGNSLGLLSGIFWGLDTAFNGFILTLVPFVLNDKKMVPAALLLAFFHDIISAVAMTGMYFLKRGNGSIWNLFRSKSAFYIIIASIFAGPIGMQAYLYAVSTIGTTLAATLSALYPALAAVLGFIFLKDKLTSLGKIGLFLSILSVMILGYDNFSLKENMLLGFLSALICVVGWASESVICAYGMKSDVSPEEALLIRQWASSIGYILLMLLSGNMVYSTVTVYNSNVLWFIIPLALIGTLSYLCYYSAIDIIGPVRATGLNITYVFWATMFAVLFFNGRFDIKIIFCGVMILMGAVLVSKRE